MIYLSATPSTGGAYGTVQGPIGPRQARKLRCAPPKQARSNVTTPAAWTVGIAELVIHNSERCRKGIPLRDTAEGFATPKLAPITTRAIPGGVRNRCARFGDHRVERCISVDGAA